MQSKMDWLFEFYKYSRIFITHATPPACCMDKLSPFTYKIRFKE